MEIAGLQQYAPGVARDFYYLRKHQSFLTSGMLLPDLKDFACYKYKNPN